MKNQILFDVAMKLLQRRADKMSEREQHYIGTHANLKILLLREYQETPNRSNIDMVFLLMFGLSFADFISVVDIDTENLRIEKELKDYQNYDKQLQQRNERIIHDWSQEYYHSREEALLQYPIRSEECDLNSNLDSVKPKKNIDNDIIQERIARLKIVKARLLSLPKEKHGELQQTEEMINRLKTWLN